jgi:structure-specific recognition protein 1
MLREEYANLEEFIKSKKIKVKNELNEETSVTYAELGDDTDEDEDMDGRRKRRRKDEVASYRDDADEDEESPDEDFAPESASDVAEDYDSNASASEDDASFDDED